MLRRRIIGLIVGCCLCAAGMARAESVPASLALDPKFGPLFESMDATVTALVRQPDGKIIIGGRFTSVGGVRRRHLARLLPNGAVDLTFDPGAGPDDGVSALALQPDGRVLVGGTFLRFAGAGRSRLARVLANGVLDTGFDPGAGANDSVTAIAVQGDGSILVGGAFTRFNDIARGRFARLSASGALDPNFAAGSGASGMVGRIVIQPDGKVLIGGGYVLFDGVVRNGLMRLNPDGTVDRTFALTRETTVSALALQDDGRIIVGAADMGGTNLFRVTATGAVDATFNPGTGPNAPVYSVSVDELGRAIVGGLFTTFNGTSRGRIVRLTASGALDATFVATGIDLPVMVAVPLPDSSVLIGGSFRAVGGIPQSAVGRLSATGARDAAFAPEFRSGGTVTSIAQQADGKWVVGGRFSHVNNVPHGRIARITASGALDASFNASVTWAASSPGAVSEVTGVAVQPDGKILLAGYFDHVNGTTRNRVARLTANGSLDVTFDPGAGTDTGINALAVDANGKILIGGSFSSYGNAPQSHFARLNGDGSLDATFDIGTGPSDWVTSIVPLPDGKILLGGGFTSYNGAPRGGVARLLASGAIDPAFAPAEKFGWGVLPVPAPDGKVYVAGTFYLNNILRTIVRLNADGSIDPTYSPAEYGSPGIIGTMELLPDGKLLAGQGVNAGGGDTKSGIARYTPTGQVDEFEVAGLVEAHVSRFVLLANGDLMVAGGRLADDLTEKFGIARFTALGAPDLPKPPKPLEFFAGTAAATSLDTTGAPAPMFKIVSGMLPAWATLNGSSGTVFGRPASKDVGDAAFTVEAANGVGVPARQEYAMSVLAAPTFAQQPVSTAVAAGNTVTLQAEAATADVAYQWKLDGIDIAGATAASLTLEDFRASSAGAYTAVITGPTGTTASRPAIVGPTAVAKVAGDATIVAENIHHPNGNVYDQVLVNGTAATITADPGEITRLSFVDLTDDIVQVEFSGAGSLTVKLSQASGPALPANYNQDVRYMKGHASIVIAGADASTNVSVFSVGRANAVNQELFRDVAYDGIADIASVAIASTDGHFNSLRAGNATLFSHQGATGVMAPGVTFDGPVYLEDVRAFDAATPVLLFGSSSEIRITGGDLEQPNAAAIQVSGLAPLQFTAGTTSQGDTLSAGTNKGRFELNGDDVTNQIGTTQ
jgi:uncharacterized delta-60 repeat protein